MYHIVLYVILYFLKSGRCLLLENGKTSKIIGLIVPREDSFHLKTLTYFQTSFKNFFSFEIIGHTCTQCGLFNIKDTNRKIRKNQLPLHLWFQKGF